ncbi:hypothetical protein [Aliiruegeria sabulilitoris]|uniref:hypothetical protein n=1 Tax=Aliiruegeria sabulilitoris TaxID=1510458 RepID=UPI00083197FC|nr:hypothetical protein [Aliiruegeria sabulilitoris]NDR56556.1 hypothetical protein [Pseudoruegeria sp. M32A2M]
MNKTVTSLLSGVLFLFAQPSEADAPPLPEIVQVFASCAGRLTAQMQHQWLLSDPAADRTEAYRAAMIDLLDAALPTGSGRQALRFRSAARQAHAALLSRATFNENARDAAWAQRRVSAEITQCEALMIR